LLLGAFGGGRQLPGHPTGQARPEPMQSAPAFLPTLDTAVDALLARALLVLSHGQLVPSVGVVAPRPSAPPAPPGLLSLPASSTVIGLARSSNEVCSALIPNTISTTPATAMTAAPM